MYIQFSTNIKSQNLGHFFEFIQILVDIGKLFHCFILLCSEESNLKVGGGAYLHCIS